MNAYWKLGGHIGAARGSTLYVPTDNETLDAHTGTVQKLTLDKKFQGFESWQL